MDTDSIMLTSLYIPIINNNVTENYISTCFHMHNIGKVNRVDFVFNRQKNRREAFIYFSEWYATDASRMLKSQLESSSLSGSEQQCRFMYDVSNKSKYWPLLLNKKPLEIDNPERKSNSVYEIEERISKIEDSIQNVSLRTDQNESNIRYILRKNKDSSLINSDMPLSKRFKEYHV